MQAGYQPTPAPVRQVARCTRLSLRDVDAAGRGGAAAVRGEDSNPAAGDGVRPARRWSAEEREKRRQLEQGVAVAGNMRRHGNLIAWRRRARPVRPYRPRHAVGQPVVLARTATGRPSSPGTTEHLPVRPALLARAGELRGRALGCWSAPTVCHADVLTTETRPCRTCVLGATRDAGQAFHLRASRRSGGYEAQTDCTVQRRRRHGGYQDHGWHASRASLGWPLRPPAINRHPVGYGCRHWRGGARHSRGDSVVGDGVGLLMLAAASAGDGER